MTIDKLITNSHFPGEQAYEILPALLPVNDKTCFIVISW